MDTWWTTIDFLPVKNVLHLSCSFVQYFTHREKCVINVPPDSLAYPYVNVQMLLQILCNVSRTPWRIIPCIHRIVHVERYYNRKRHITLQYCTFIILSQSCDNTPLALSAFHLGTFSAVFSTCRYDEHVWTRTYIAPIYCNIYMYIPCAG